MAGFANIIFGSFNIYFPVQMVSIDDPELKYKIGITLIPGIGSVIAKKMIEFTGGPGEVFKAGKNLLEKIPGIGKKLAANISNQQILDKAQKEIEFISKYEVKTYYCYDEDYPERLKECPDSPVLLFMKGKSDLNHPKVLSIVGTRNASSYGLEFCRELVRDLARKGHNPLIVSGLAYGIDICAHKAALENDLHTVAALAHGLSTIYPPLHRNVARDITGNGALVTDFISTCLPEKGNFIKRNRIIAGLADATIVIESRTRGGALLTADLANSYNRDVFSLPGRINDKRSQGCNNLIKTHKAALIEDSKDIEYILGWTPAIDYQGKTDSDHYADTGEDEKLILMLLADNAELPIDRIIGETGLGVSNTSCLLLDLEFKGYITCLPGKRYMLANRLRQYRDEKTS